MGSELGIKVKRFYDDVAGKRSVYETIWLQDLRQYKGIYDPEILAKMDAKRSKSFIRETRTKVRTIDARIMDLLFPANSEKNWGIEPTPTPSVPQPIEEMLLTKMAMILQEGGQDRPPTQEELIQNIKDYTLETCKNMSQEIDDQLSEIKYRGIIRDVMHSGHLYGTGWLKGPLVDQVVEPHWEMVQVQEGFTWQLVQKQINRPYAEFRPIWDIYPDMSVTDIGLCRFFCERHIMPRHKLLQLATRPDFNAEIILQYIKDNPNGKAEYANFENELYNLKDKNTKPRPEIKGAYELIEYWGYVSVNDLADLNPEQFTNLGIQVEGDLPANVWVIDNEVVKIALQPIAGLAIPYYAYYFDKDETSIFGEGIASIMRDPQRLVNASIRAMIDNAAHCAGPQYEVNVDLLADGEDPTDIGAFKVWMRTGRDADIAGKEVVRVKTLASYTPEFMNMYGMFSRLGDEVTIIPRYMQGDARVSGAGRTASGLSMLMGQANIGLSDLVKVFDDGVTKPFITAMYNWNMQFNDKENIKGDMKIIARGSTALMAKEIRAQQIQTFLQMTLNAEDATWVKRGNLLKRWAESTDIGSGEAVYTEEEHAALMEQRQQAMQQAQAQAQAQEVQSGAGYNQLESVIKQLEEGMSMMAEKLSGIEQVIMQSVQNARRQQISGGAA
jgi:hypothetical protein